MFDPYHKWLGIPKDQRPPTHYQLLGISPDERDAEVIERAAQMRTGFLRGHMTGPHSAACQKVLASIERAAEVLTDEHKRELYDQKLAERSGAISLGADLGTERTAATEVRRKSADAGFNPIPHVLGGMTAVALFLYFNGDLKHFLGDSPPAADASRASVRSAASAPAVNSPAPRGNAIPQPRPPIPPATRRPPNPVPQPLAFAETAAAETPAAASAVETISVPSFNSPSTTPVRLQPPSPPSSRPVPPTATTVPAPASSEPAAVDQSKGPSADDPEFAVDKIKKRASKIATTKQLALERYLHNAVLLEGSLAERAPGSWIVQLKDAGVTVLSDRIDGAPYRAGTIVLVWGIARPGGVVEAIYTEALPPELNGRYQLRPPGAVKGYSNQVFVVEGYISNTGKQPVATVECLLRVKIGSQIISRTVTVTEIAPGKTKTFLESFPSYYSDSVSVPAVEMQLTNYGL